MVVEVYTNNASTTLNGTINNSVTSLVVTSATGFPTSGNFRIIVEDEIMLVTAVSGTTFTVTRAHEGTTGASHASGVAVTQVHTAGAIDSIRSDQIKVGAYGSRPAASKAGNLWISNDGPYISHDSGSVWAILGPLHKMTPVVPGDFSWVNQLSATETIRGGVACLESEAGRATPSLAMRLKTAPSTPYTVTVGFVGQVKPTTGQTVNSFFGFIWRESSTGKVFNMNIFQCDTPDRFVSFTQPSATGAFTTVTNFTGNIGRPIWFQLHNDGTNLVWRHSVDGLTFHQISTVAKTTPFTTGPDQVGYVVNGGETRLSVYSWLET